MKFDKLGIPYEEVSAVEEVTYLLSIGYAAAPVVEVDFGEGATVHWSGYRPTFIEQLRDTLADKQAVGSVSTPED